MNTNAFIIPLFLFFTINLCSCSTYCVNSTPGQGDITSMDSIYISGIKIYSDDAGNLEHSLVKNCCFSLSKRDYRVASFIQSSVKADDFNYHAYISIHSKNYGDILNPQVSTAFFFDIHKKGSNIPVAVIRLTSRRCNIHDVRHQVELAETLAEKMDSMVDR